MPTRLSTRVHHAIDWTIQASQIPADPWRTMSAVAVVNGRRVPGFWAGGASWTFRLSEAVAGEWEVRVESSDASLHDQRANLCVLPSSSETNPLYKHGPVRLNDARTGFSHHDGTRFLWLGDTWWMLMSDRVAFPTDFSKLVHNRASLGFNVIQTVVGFPPDTKPFEVAANNEGGSPWLENCATINPAYFDACDRRLAAIIDAGMVPCILGTWGYHQFFTGEETMTHHWRYLVARYAAWPVIFCLAGETAMRYYLSPNPVEQDVANLQQAWSRIGKVVADLDPYHRPLTTHPRSCSFEDLADHSMLDFHMTQSGHMPSANGWALKLFEKASALDPKKPFVQGEPPYEGHGGTNGPDVQRYAYWTSILSGCSGFTYGAAGIFQANDPIRPTPKRPDGGTFDRWTWDQAIHFEGAAQLGKAHKFLSTLPFNDFVVDPTWVSAPLRWGQDGYHPPYRLFAAGVPKVCRVIYIPMRWYHWDGPTIHKLEPGLTYTVTYLDPESFDTYDAGTATADANGNWTGPGFKYMHDWVVVLKVK
jgi:hypothetical protein